MTEARDLAGDAAVRRGLPRAVELSLAVVGLVAVSPVLLLCALLIKTTSQGPVLFRQQRVGRHGKPFTLLKLRSMTASAPSTSEQVTAAGDPRVTGVGRLLRRTKLDELPELWNIARGDMSLVGPRPEVPRYVDLDDPLWQRAMGVRPGLTDPASLVLRSEESVLALIDGDRSEVYQKRLLPYKLRLSVAYLENRSGWSDLRILGQTALALVRPRPDAGAVLRQLLEIEPEVTVGAEDTENTEVGESTTSPYEP